MTDIYQQHDKAFRGVAAFVVLDDDGQLIGRVSFTYARSGLRTTCYFHVLGLPMVKAFAGGGGYDKASAAAHACVAKIMAQTPAKHELAGRVGKVWDALKHEGGSWDTMLGRATGFRVIQAV